MTRLVDRQGMGGNTSAPATSQVPQFPQVSYSSNYVSSPADNLEIENLAILPPIAKSLILKLLSNFLLCYETRCCSKRDLYQPFLYIVFSMSEDNQERLVAGDIQSGCW